MKFLEGDDASAAMSSNIDLFDTVMRIVWVMRS